MEESANKIDTLETRIGQLSAQLRSQPSTAMSKPEQPKTEVEHRVESKSEPKEDTGIL